MLYVIHMANHSNLTYRGGQEPIIHLAANFKDAVAWADANNRKWAFTDFNAGAYGCNDYAKPADLEKINWRAIRARIWRGDLMEGKQAEFLMEYAFPWHLIKRIGTCSTKIAEYATNALDRVFHRPRIEVKRDWYY